MHYSEIYNNTKSGEKMFVTIIRTLMLYAAITLAVRIMGKRQLSDMQPSELVVTLIIADIAAIPMEDNSISVVSGMIPMMVLVACEIIVSILMMKSTTFRKLACGNPVMLIKDGKLLQDKMRSLRMTTEDLCVQLRQSGVFSLEDVQYCIAETNGRLSVLQKPSKRNPSAEDMNITIEDNGIEVVVINDGKFLDASIELAQSTKDELNKILQKNNATVEKVFIMTFDRDKNYNIIEKE